MQAVIVYEQSVAESFVVGGKIHIKQRTVVRRGAKCVSTGRRHHNSAIDPPPEKLIRARGHVDAEITSAADDVDGELAGWLDAATVG